MISGLDTFPNFYEDHMSSGVIIDSFRDMLNAVTFFYNQEGMGLKRPSASFLKNLKLSSTVLRQSLDSILILGTLP